MDSRYNFTTFLVILIFVVVGLQGCVTAPPQNVDNICNIFREKDSWYKAAKAAQDKWGSPIPVTMAFMHQESRFNGKAKPPRKKILWVIPGPRASSAYGYSQAKSTTWDWYVKDSGNRGADRDSFKDSADFIAWYNAQSNKIIGLSMTDTYSLYLAFHEGHGGFKRKTYQNKDWLRSVASKVTQRANSYASQLQTCEKDLNKSRWWPF